ncbi:hydroxyproline-rich glycoprotein family protein [Anaeramoeba flamelloides]|uniref:Hydroxyproline-rich glycoprotein family protein n=1 Tax=Anaeramoeba flamelloides TaxID=1746091 RepID=A0AAV7Z0C6_9EUKA|nr:hydroxyproline-rich glycoprotein family protein [Anaeramoeba flamelloides]KAJ6227270.1 hydroxyproline-rich glycoprotein family protein [Anaeramoeba flamelloides]
MSLSEKQLLQNITNTPRIKKEYLESPYMSPTDMAVSPVSKIIFKDKIGQTQTKGFPKINLLKKFEQESSKLHTEEEDDEDFF